jgi:hypothetical protein
VLRLHRPWLVTLVGCSTLLSRETPADQPGGAPLPRKTVQHVVLIALDGVRYQEIFTGVEAARARRAGVVVVDQTALMPHLWALARRGVALGAPTGAAFAMSGPNFVSLPGYAEMLSGRPAACHENNCPGPAAAKTLVDAVCETVQAEPCSAAVFSSWPEIERVATSEPGRALLSTGREGGNARALLREIPELAALHERGRRAAPAPGYGGYRPDHETARLALSYLEHDRPRFTFIGLGDTDELAHAGDYGGYLRALGEADEVIGKVSDLAARWESMNEPTVVVVTTDHGRAESFRDHGGRFPESQRSWLVAAGTGVPARGAIRLERTRFMRDLAPTLAGLLGVAFAPPVEGELLDEILDTP